MPVPFGTGIAFLQCGAQQHLEGGGAAQSTARQDRGGYIGIETMQATAAPDKSGGHAPDPCIQTISTTAVEPDAVNGMLLAQQSSPIAQKRHLHELLLRPELSLNHLMPFIDGLPVIADDRYYTASDILQSAELRLKYEAYIVKEQQAAEKYKQLEHVPIPRGFNFHQLESLSTEARQKLSRIAPTTVGEAKRIPGISPNDINVLLVYFGR